MENENQENVFDQVDAESSPKKNTESPDTTLDHIEQPEVNEIPKSEEEILLGDVSDEVTYDIELKKEDEGKEFVIESAEILKPRLRDADGNVIEPIVSQSGSSKYYESKLQLLFDGTTYKALVPKIMWFLNFDENTGKTILRPSFKTNIAKDDLEDQFTSDLSKLYFKFCEATGEQPGKVGIKTFVDSLVGKRVKLTTKRGKFNGQNWTKIVVDSFIE